MKFNPFDHIVETYKHYRNARILRSSLAQRFKDSFKVTFGEDYLINYFFSSSGQSDEIGFGLGDYFLLGLPSLMGGLAILCSDFLGSLFKAELGEFFDFIIGFPVFLLMASFAVTAAALVSAKAVLSAALTLIASPFVFLAHLITSANRNELMKELDDLSLKVCEEIREEREVAGRSQFVKVLKINDQSQRLQDFISDNSDADFDFSSAAIICPVAGGEKLDDETNPQLGIYDSEGPYNRKLKAIIEIKPENKVGIDALLQMNFFQTTSQLERGLHPNVFKSLEKQLDDDLVPAIAARIGLAS